MKPSTSKREPTRLTRYAWLSIAAALSTMGLKSVAYILTGSVGLLSDAAESIVNLVAAGIALYVLRFSAQPPDDEHPYGHEKAEYFSSGVEGALIVVAACAIGVSAAPRILHPRPLESPGLGLALSVAASAVNLVVARVLLRVGKTHRSIVLEADGHHLMTDVWTSAGVVAGLCVVLATGWTWFDPLIALGVAAYILRTGWLLLRRSANGLLDTSLPTEERAAIVAVLDRYGEAGARWHALRTRRAGARRFVAVHVLVPGEWTVQRGHDLLERLEAELRATAPMTDVTTHLEPLEDERSHTDLGLDREESPIRVRDA